MSPAKKAPAKKAHAKKKAPAKKAPAKRAPAKKKAPAKKTTPFEAMPRPRERPTSEGRRADVEMKPGPVVHEVLEAEPIPVHDNGWDDEWGDLGWDEAEFEEDDRGPDDAPSGPDAGASSEAADRFQTAARELIDAARTMLDVAEDAVADPHAIRSVFGSLRGFADDVFRVASQANPMARRPHEEDPDDPDDFLHIPID